LNGNVRSNSRTNSRILSKSKDINKNEIIFIDYLNDEPDNSKIKAADSEK
jgi:hypothetical protein